jgi:hypothetical protein
MELNKTEIFIVSTAIETLYLDKGKCRLNEKGIIKLAKIQAKFAEQLLPLEAKNVVKSLTQKMLENIDYTKDDVEQKITE